MTVPGPDTTASGTNNGNTNNRLVFVIEALTVGGAEHMLVAMANRLCLAGWQCHVICLTTAGDLSNNLVDGIERHVLNKKPGFDWSLPQRLRRLIKTIDPLAVNCHLWTANTWTRLSLLGCGMRIVVTEHSRDSWKGKHYRLIDRLLASAMYRLVAVSSDTADFYRSEIGISGDKVVVINNGIDTARFRNADGATVRQQLASEGQVLIGTIGRMISAKNHLRLLNAFAQLKDEFPDARLVYVGDGPERCQLEAQIKAQSLDELVTLTGTRNDVAEIFKALDVFVLSSDREGHPLTALEAQSAGTPVVLTNAGGSTDAIVRSATADKGATKLHQNDYQLGKIPRDTAGNPLAAGILVEKSAEAIALAMRELLSDDALRTAMGQTGMQQAEFQFDEDVMVGCYVALFTQ